MKRVVVRPDAAGDVQDAYDWYESQSRGLGDEFLTELAETVRRLFEFPEASPIIHRSTRRALVPRRFPYGVFYRLSGDTIIVVAVLHASRDPDVWRRRR